MRRRDDGDEGNVSHRRCRIGRDREIGRESSGVTERAARLREVLTEEQKVRWTIVCLYSLLTIIRLPRLSPILSTTYYY